MQTNSQNLLKSEAATGGGGGRSTEKVFLKISQIHRKKSVLKSLFNKVAGAFM